MASTQETIDTGEWPPHFPIGCPPRDAAELSGNVLYLVRSNPPAAEDFLSAAERGAFPDAPACERAALSCGLTRDYIERLRRSVPRLRAMHVARASLQAHHGKLKQTMKPGHHSMWLRTAALRAAPRLFEVIE